jgi:dienelactone hydrolase
MLLLLELGVPIQETGSKPYSEQGQAPITSGTSTVSLEAQARGVLTDMAAHRFDKVVAQFNSRMAAALSAERLAQAWDTISAMAGGEFRSAGKATVTEVQGNHVVRIDCDFDGSTVPATISIDSEGHVAGFFLGQPQPKKPWSPPDYADPSSFEEYPVAVGQEPMKLTGILTLPKVKNAGETPTPPGMNAGETPALQGKKAGGTPALPGGWAAVVLVQGSGPTDQDETIGPNKPFRDLAWGLASKGVAVLRYNKRTFQYPASFKGQFTVEEESIADARAGVALLAARPEVDPHRIFVVGHSLGAMLAPRIAKGDPQVAGIVIMAGNTRPLEDLIVEQVKYQASLAGKPTPETERAIADAEKSAAQIRNVSLAPADTVNALGNSIPGSYFLDLRAYDPAKTAAGLTVPILVLQGERDCQVRMADYEGWKQALSGQPRASFHLYPNLYHLFMPVPASDTTALSTPADYLQPGHVSSEVVADIASWIKAQNGITGNYQLR